MNKKTTQTRVMPQAIDAEKAFISEILTSNQELSATEAIVNPMDFYNRTYALIYQTALCLQARGELIDPISLIEELKRSESLESVGGISAITEIFSQSAFIPGRSGYYARIIKQKSISRKLIEICLQTANQCFDEAEDIATIIENLEIEFTQLTRSMNPVNSLSMEEAVNLTLTQIRKLYDDRQNGVVSGIPTHLPKLTEAYGGGFRAPELIVLGARPSMGKTQHALEMAYAAGMNGCSTLFCSLEMSTVQLVKRLLLRDERISEVHINNGDLSREEFIALDESVGAIRPAKIFFADNHAMRQLANIKKEARRLKRKENIQFLVVDYLGLIRTGLSFGLRTQEIAHITGDLKALAKELDIAVLLLCQLSRPMKGQQARVPVMEDLRESGDIEQDADTVLLLHKYDFYDKNAVDGKGISQTNRGVLIRDKYREGERNVTFQFAHDKRYKKIFDYVESEVDFLSTPMGNIFSDDYEN